MTRHADAGIRRTRRNTYLRTAQQSKIADKYLEKQWRDWGIPGPMTTSHILKTAEDGRLSEPSHEQHSPTKRRKGLNKGGSYSKTRKNSYIAQGPACRDGLDDPTPPELKTTDRGWGWD